MKLTSDHTTISAKALTKHQAVNLCKALQHLAGTKHILNHQQIGTVECVTVAPFDEVNKYIFLERYKESKNASAALEFYSVPYFDVVLIVRSQDEKKLFLVKTDFLLEEYINMSKTRNNTQILQIKA